MAMPPAIKPSSINRIVNRDAPAMIPAFRALDPPMGSPPGVVPTDC